MDQRTGVKFGELQFDKRYKKLQRSLKLAFLKGDQSKSQIRNGSGIESSSYNLTGMLLEKNASNMYHEALATSSVKGDSVHSDIIPFQSPLYKKILPHRNVLTKQQNVIYSMPTTSNDKKNKSFRLFFQWKVQLNEEAQLIIKGILQCGRTARSKPIKKRLSSTNVESIFKSTYHLQGNLVDNRFELPDFVRNKFYYGFPEDWENVCQIWRKFIKLGSPVTFCWPTHITYKDDESQSEVTYLEESVFNSSICSSTIISRIINDPQHELLGHACGSRNSETSNNFMQPSTSGTTSNLFSQANAKTKNEEHKCNHQITQQQNDLPLSQNSTWENLFEITKFIKEEKLNIIINNLADTNCSKEYIDKFIQMLECLKYIVSHAPQIQDKSDARVSNTRKETLKVHRNADDLLPTSRHLLRSPTKNNIDSNAHDCSVSYVAEETKEIFSSNLSKRYDDQLEKGSKDENNIFPVESAIQCTHSCRHKIQKPQRPAHSRQKIRRMQKVLNTISDEIHNTSNPPPTPTLGENSNLNFTNDSIKDNKNECSLTDEDLISYASPNAKTDEHYAVQKKSSPATMNHTFNMRKPTIISSEPTNLKLKILRADSVEENTPPVDSDTSMNKTESSQVRCSSKLKEKTVISLLYLWLPEVDEGLIFRGQVLNESGLVTKEKFSTGIVKRRLSPKVFETVGGEMYRLVGDLYDPEHVVPKHLVRSCRYGCPQNIDKFCLTWKRLLKEADTSIKNTTVDTIIDCIDVPVSSKGRKIIPPLNYWDGERIFCKDDKPVYQPGNAPVTGLVESLKKKRGGQKHNETEIFKRPYDDTSKVYKKNFGSTVRNCAKQIIKKDKESSIKRKRRSTNEEERLTIEENISFTQKKPRYETKRNSADKFKNTPGKENDKFMQTKKSTLQEKKALKKMQSQKIEIDESTQFSEPNSSIQTNLDYRFSSEKNRDVICSYYKNIPFKNDTDISDDQQSVF